MRTILHIGVLKEILPEGSISAKDLVTIRKMDEQLLGRPHLSQFVDPYSGESHMLIWVVRMMRPLTASGIVRSDGENMYAHTRFSLPYVETSEGKSYELVYIHLNFQWSGSI